MTRSTIRPASVADAEAITQVNIASWCSSYRGLLPDEYLGAMDYASGLQQWRTSLRRADVATFVAENADGELVGYSIAGPNRDPTVSVPGELYAIYLRENEIGRGTGHALFEAARAWLRGERMSPFVLWVLKDNARARRFYEREGGELIGEKPLEIGGSSYVEVAYRFS